MSRKKGLRLMKKRLNLSLSLSYKLVEEVGETSKNLLESNWKEIQAEVYDVIIFACKIANITEDFHDAESLEKVIEKKLGYCETSVTESRKFN